MKRMQGNIAIHALTIMSCAQRVETRSLTSLVMRSSTSTPNPCSLWICSSLVHGLLGLSPEELKLNGYAVTNSLHGSPS
eukprot:326498-Pelagomonas_calceolata.AAC.2